MFETFYYSFEDIHLKISILKENQYKISKIEFLKNSQTKDNFSHFDKELYKFYNEIENFFYFYFEKKLHLSFEKIFLSGTEKQTKIWNKLRNIPFGKLISYQDLAILSGLNKKYVRFVGNTCRLNPIPIIIPCHRVIGKNQKLIGYSGGIPLKKRLLEHENSIYQTRT